MRETKELVGRLSEDNLPPDMQDALVEAFRDFHEP
jgi:hypothetical protein